LDDIGRDTIRATIEGEPMPFLDRAVFSMFLVFGLFGFAASMRLPQDENKASAAKLPEVTPRRPECGLFLPERGERHDMARLMRADQFLDCERDGFPKHLAPPWKETVEAEKKFGEACEYFAAKSAKEYPRVGQANLKLAADRCRINVMQVILMKTVEGLGQPPK
jgi:hypothetical protein